MHCLLKIVLPSLTWRLKTKEKVIYLTFDDGPNKILTPFILKELREFDAKATFFLLGKCVIKENALYQQIKKEGHTIGNHTFSHLNGWQTKNLSYFSDIERCNKIIKSDMFRPPYGRIKLSQIRYLKRKYKLIMWDVLSWDFDQRTSPEKCLEIVINKAKPGSILVFHENEQSSENVKYTLPKVLKHFKSRGYKFKAL